VYAGVAEVSVHIAAKARGQGVGAALLRELVAQSERGELVAQSEREGLWTLQAGIFPENTASVQLHQRCGFRVVSTRERLGCRSGRWRDVLLMERRSAVPG